MSTDSAFWTEAARIHKLMAGAMFRENQAAMEGHIQDLADHFGFDLVKQRTPQQAHEAMLAARLAEDPISDTERDLKRARANEERDFSNIGGGRVG